MYKSVSKYRHQGPCLTVYHGLRARCMIAGLDHGGLHFFSGQSEAVFFADLLKLTIFIEKTCLEKC